jgi:hypothetical protein
MGTRLKGKETNLVGVRSGAINKFLILRYYVED